MLCKKWGKWEERLILSAYLRASHIRKDFFFEDQKRRKKEEKGDLFFLRKRMSPNPKEEGANAKLFCIFFTRICKWNPKPENTTTLSFLTEGQTFCQSVFCVWVCAYKYKRVGAEEAERESGRDTDEYLLHNKLIKGFFLSSSSFHFIVRRRV